MNRKIRRMDRTIAMDKALNHIQTERHSRFYDLLHSDGDIINDPTLRKYDTQIWYLTKKIATNYYTKECMHEDYAKWASVADELQENGLKHSEAWYTIQSAFWRARYWQIEAHVRTLKH